MIHKKVLFNINNQYYWLHETPFGFYNISPLNHYDKDGKLLTPYDVCYAIMHSNGVIERFGQVIGYEPDLIDVKE